MGKTAIIAIDQGTTSTRAIAFDTQTNALAQSQEEFNQHYPADGWVEHDPEDIWQTTISVTRSVLKECEQKGVQPLAIGITNQRETTIAWNKKTGRPICNAIVWQDRRTAEYCSFLKSQGHEPAVTLKTGLLLDPYFSASKMNWILKKVSGAAELAEKGLLAFGTVDTYLIWRLTKGQSFLTDATNASRTNLFNIHNQSWDKDLLDLFEVPGSTLPEVRDSASDFGETDKDILGCTLPILGVAGDQQAATVGQGCFNEGDIKSTYGTGCFVMMNTGETPVQSHHRLLTTVAYRLNGKTNYALEGSIFIAGAAIQWLRDGLKTLENAEQTEEYAAQLSSNEGVVLVPAFTGLGAPYWQPTARGALFGITRDTGPAHLARAALESVCYQTFDLLEAMEKDGVVPAQIRVDGGMVANNWAMQFLSNILNIPVLRPRVTETTALGAACLAGLQAGLFTSLQDISTRWQQDRCFKPGMEEADRTTLVNAWKKAVQQTLNFS